MTSSRGSSSAALGERATDVSIYWERMRDVAVPTLLLASDGDRLNVHPECAARFALRAREK